MESNLSLSSGLSSGYILLNVVLLAVLVWGITRLAKEEARDVYMLNDRFTAISGNAECVNYLQLITNIPYWRFAIFSSAAYTTLLFLLFVLSGYPITKTVIFVFWALFLLNAIFVYKTLGTRDFHYVCKNNCKPEWH